MFSCLVQIRMSDLDPFNHVNNGAQCNLFDYGRTVFFEKNLNMEIDWMSFDLVLVHVEMDYLQPIHIHDEISCETEIYDVGEKSIKMRQYLMDTVSGVLKTECKCTLVAIDRDKMVSKEVPEIYKKLKI